MSVDRVATWGPANRGTGLYSGGWISWLGVTGNRVARYCASEALLIARAGTFGAERVFDSRAESGVLQYLVVHDAFNTAVSGTPMRMASG